MNMFTGDCKFSDIIKVFSFHPVKIITSVKREVLLQQIIKMMMKINETKKSWNYQIKNSYEK